jgi:hypothetical protein
MRNSIRRVPPVFPSPLDTLVTVSSARACVSRPVETNPGLIVAMATPVPLDLSLLVLSSDEEGFLKRITKIDDVQELRDHIHRVATEAYKASRCMVISSRKALLTSFAGVSVQFHWVLYVRKVNQPISPFTA